MVDISNITESMADDLARFFDIWNILGGTGVLLIGILSFLFGGFSTESVLAAVTGLYAYISFNQMREARWRRRPASRLAVRPHFVKESGSEDHDVGLKNFGSSPALNLRLKGLLKQNGEEVAQFTVSSSDRHLHLEQGEYLSFSSVHNQLGDLSDPESDLYDDLEQKYIELYYTFESNDGIQYPRDLNRPGDLDMEAVVKKSPNPRTLQLSEIYEKCT